MSVIKNREEWIYIILLFLIIFIMYLYSAPRTVVLEDDGYFILAAYFNGIPHPPGYPVYTLLSHLATYFPMGSVAYRVHAFSAFFGASSCISLFYICRFLISERIYAYSIAIIYAFSKTFWSQSIIAEVYTLNVFLFFTLVTISLHYSNQNSNKKSKLHYVFGFMLGLALSNHWPLIVLSSPLIISILWPVRHKLVQNSVSISFFILLGLSPYIWMFYRSQMDPEISFYGPLVNLSDLWFYISREGYAGIETSISAGLIDKVNFTLFLFKEMVAQFGITGFLFAVIGFISQWRTIPVRVCVGLTLCVLGNTVVLVALLGFDFDLHHQNIFRVYPLIAYAVMALWIALGLLQVVNILANNSLFIVRKKISVTGFLILIISTTLILNLPLNYRANDTWADDYARTILNSLKPNSVLFTYGDLTTGPIGYLNQIEGIRSDVTLFSSKGQVFSNRLFRPFKITKKKSQQLIDSFIDETDRTVYYLYGLNHRYGTEEYGLFNRVAKNLPANNYRDIALPEIDSYFFRIHNKGEPQDPWEKIHYHLIIANYCKFKFTLEYPDSVNQFRDNNGPLPILCDNFHSQLEFIGLLLSKTNPDLFLAASLLSKAEEISDQSILKQDIARLYYYRGEINLRKGQQADAIKDYHDSINIWQHPDNPAYVKMNALKEQSDQVSTITK